MYSRNEMEFKRGCFRVKGDTVDVRAAHGDFAYRFVFFGNEVEKIEMFEPGNGGVIDRPDEVRVYPANIFVTTKDRMNAAIRDIQDDLVKQCAFFESMGKLLEAKRLKQRV
jgi:excinuclease ABC subunit B